MTENKTVIETFYNAFQKRDYASMIACYHDNVHFSDPVFTDLIGDQAKAMWHMLCERGQDLQVIYNGVQANENNGRAHWEATYTFSTGRPVHNIIEAQFEFQDGKIVRHQDHFDLWRWTRMALGLSGILLGWTPMVQTKVRETGMKSLHKFMADHPEYK